MALSLAHLIILGGEGIVKRSWLIVGLGMAAVLGGRAQAADLVLPFGGLVSIDFMSSEVRLFGTLSLLSPGVISANGCKVEDFGALAGEKLVSEKFSRPGCRIDLDFDPAAPGRQPYPA